MAVDVDRLIEIQHPVHSPAERVENVVRVLRPEAGEQHAPHVGFAISVGIFEMDKLRTVGDVRSSIRIMRTRGIDATAIYARRKQYIIDKWAAVPQINHGPLELIRRVSMSL